MARKFFYVCAGMLMLALAYHFGASTAGAVVGFTIEGASIQSIPGTGGFPRAGACVDRRLNWMGENGLLQVIPVPIPGTQRVLATDPGFGTVMSQAHS